eukprot:scaffold1954_cov146-Alexandrium_tamarense.AAC.10
MMCWSYQASISFSITESILISFIFIRAIHSKNKYVRQQLHIMPMMCSVCGERDYMLSSSSLLLLLLLLLHCSQLSYAIMPYFAIFACRRGGRHRNWTLLEVPEKLSLLFGMSMIASYLYTITSAKTAKLRTLADSDYLSYLNTETCTYLGRGGHFHWTLASADSFIVPNSYTYALLWFSCSFARPLRLFSGILFFGLVLFMLFLVELGGSFEAGSVWCWSAIILILYITVQPYLLPIHDCGRSNDNKQHEKSKSITSRVSFSSNAKMTV